jgi:hydroxymethylpyrimidine/phosphomethylpyrimidine kinase
MNIKASVSPVTLPIVLTIAGSDSGGSAGIQADLHAFAANGAFGTTAITCITAQNPRKISDYEPLDPTLVTAQIERVLEFFPVNVVKTGMLGTGGIVECVARLLEREGDLLAVVDPVMVSSTGTKLIDDDAIEMIQSKLLPWATIITPNLDELAVLTGIKAESPLQMLAAGAVLAKKYSTFVLIKGGHLDAEILTDLLIDEAGEVVLELQAHRVARVNTHGSGCTYAAAIGANLASGMTVPKAVELAHEYLQRTIRTSLNIDGELFIHHYAGYGV